MIKIGRAAIDELGLSSNGDVLRVVDYVPPGQEYVCRPGQRFHSGDTRKHPESRSRYILMTKRGTLSFIYGDGWVEYARRYQQRLPEAAK